MQPTSMPALKRTTCAIAELVERWSCGEEVQARFRGGGLAKGVSASGM
jgi:hypothetical protein